MWFSQWHLCYQILFSADSSASLFQDLSNYRLACLASCAPFTRMNISAIVFVVDGGGKNFSIWKLTWTKSYWLSHQRVYIFQEMVRHFNMQNYISFDPFKTTVLQYSKQNFILRSVTSVKICDTSQITSHNSADIILGLRRRQIYFTILCISYVTNTRKIRAFHFRSAPYPLIRTGRAFQPLWVCFIRKLSGTQAGGDTGGFGMRS